MQSIKVTHRQIQSTVDSFRANGPRTPAAKMTLPYDLNTNTSLCRQLIQKTSHQISYADVARGNLTKLQVPKTNPDNMQHVHNIDDIHATHMQQPKNTSLENKSQHILRRQRPDRRTKILAEYSSNPAGCPSRDSMKTSSDSQGKKKSFITKHAAPGDISQVACEYAPSANALERLASIVKESHENLIRELQNCASSTADGLSNLSMMIQSLAKMFEAFLSPYLSGCYDLQLNNQN